jgi:phosphoglycerate dehydrogenase-like enzyme
MKNFKVAIAINKSMAEQFFDAESYGFLRSFAEVNPIEELPAEMSLEFISPIIQEADACLTCWGTPNITDELIAQAKKLRLVAHTTGSIKALIPSGFWQRGGRVTSNAAVIAEDVAQTALAYIMCSTKGLWQFAQSTRAGKWGEDVTGTLKTSRMDGLRVGIISASNVGRELIKLLKPFGCVISLYDPYISPFDLADLGVTPIGLDDLMANSDIISLCAPAIEECRHMINKNNIPLMKDGTLFINTARGMLVDEAALINELATGRIQACLDVTDPEPPAADHPFRKMPNVILTPHIAGGHTANGRLLLGRTSVNEVFNYLHKGILKYEVRREMLERMA